MTTLIPGTADFVERLLAERIGLDVASVGEGLIVRGVQTRMSQLGVRRVEDYQRILLGPTDELQALIEEVVIPESWFFRDDRPFATFREFVQAGWVDQSNRRRISVLCLPCAAGEEPYSVAIALLELGMPRERFEVVAVDISDRSIHRATMGMYSVNAFRGMPPKIKDDYFTPIRGRFLLKSAVRSAVRFERGNILDANLLADHDSFDVVFCRNLLIYFDDAARARAFSNLDRLVAGDGLLFLGHADRPDQDTGTRFVPYADNGSFVYRKRTQLAGGQTPGSSHPASKPVTAARPPNPLPKPPPSRPVTRPPGADAPLRSPPVASPRPEPVVPTPRGIDEVMTQASTLADQGRYTEAIKWIRDNIGSGSLNAGAHFLLGIIYQAAGNRVEAEAELNKAVYLNPEHDEALLALALLARRKGDVAAEALYRRRADRVLARKGRS